MGHIFHIFLDEKNQWISFVYSTSLGVYIGEKYPKENILHYGHILREKNYPEMKLVITLVVLICFALNINAKDDRGYCYYFNDPHLIPFPSVPGEQQGVYFCKSNCTEVLLKNKFVEIFVTADPQGMYPIIEVSYFHWIILGIFCPFFLC